MAERKRWDKHSDFHPSALGGNGSAVDAAGPTAANDPVLEKQRQYIKMLEERNRLKKKLAAASKTQKEKDVLQEREEAFVTTFNVPKSAAALFIASPPRLDAQMPATWGHLNYIDLTQLDMLVGKDGVPYPLDLSQVDTTPRDLESLSYHGDPQPFDKAR
uniref:KATNIP domain-containing protein n=1 Tax=Globisporangium ultimum (strain ATCC 200006 / CBS 805.95 / DAOM BR144) TaxID=431595 RepID=K3WCS1_GLOUD